MERYGSAILAFFLGFMLMTMYWSIARSQDIYLHQPHVHDGVAGQFYSTWFVPNNGLARQASCCNQKDCYSTEIKKQGAVWFARRREDGQWIPIPEGKLEHNQHDARESPDGFSHVCMAHPDGGSNVYCAVLGSRI